MHVDLEEAAEIRVQLDESEIFSLYGGFELEGSLNIRSNGIIIEKSKVKVGTYRRCRQFMVLQDRNNDHAYSIAIDPTILPDLYQQCRVGEYRSQGSKAILRLSCLELFEKRYCYQ